MKNCSFSDRVVWGSPKLGDDMCALPLLINFPINYNNFFCKYCVVFFLHVLHFLVQIFCPAHCKIVVALSEGKKHLEDLVVDRKMILEVI